MESAGKTFFEKANLNFFIIGRVRRKDFAQIVENGTPLAHYPVYDSILRAGQRLVEFLSIVHPGCVVADAAGVDHGCSRRKRTVV